MAYHMRMVFLIDVTDNRLNDITKLIDNSSIVIPNALKCTIDQTVSFVPDKEMLKKYEQIILKTYSTGNVAAKAVRFSHYEVFEQVPDQPADKKGE